MIRLALLALLFAAPAAAADMSVFLKNGAPHDVAVELSSASRGHRWPGDDQVYLLEKDAKKSLRLTCEAGERICWGGWRNGDDGVTYGIGPDGDRQCRDCCFICVEKTTATVAVE